VRANPVPAMGGDHPWPMRAGSLQPADVRLVRGRFHGPWRWCLILELLEPEFAVYAPLLRFTFFAEDLAVAPADPVVRCRQPSLPWTHMALVWPRAANTLRCRTAACAWPSRSPTAPVWRSRNAGEDRGV